MPTIRVPREVQQIAQRAIARNMELPISQRAAYTENKNGDRIPGTGMRTARILASGQIDKVRLQMMVGWFARHKESTGSAEARQDQTSKAAIAWALWGGNAGYTWAKRALRDWQ